MELVYPIYLDTPIMTAFLASLEGGVSEETSIEGKTTNSKEKSGKVSFGIKVSELISSLVGANAEADLSRKISDNLESQYKSTIKFPKEAFANIANSLKADDLEINISNPIIKGPTLILAVLAIFA